MPNKRRTSRKSNNSTVGIPRAANRLQQRFGCWVGVSNLATHDPANLNFTLDISAQFSLGFKQRFGNAWRNFRMTAYDVQVFCAPKDPAPVFPNFPILLSQYDVSAKDFQTPGSFLLPLTFDAMLEQPNVVFLSLDAANVRSLKRFRWRCKDLQNLPFQDIAVNDPSQLLTPILNNVGILGFTATPPFTEIFTVQAMGRIYCEFKDVGCYNPPTEVLAGDYDIVK